MQVLRKLSHRAALRGSILKKGRKIPIVGGSDFHKRLLPLKFANPVTAVFADALAGNSMVFAVAWLLASG